MLLGRAPVRISFGGGGTDLAAYYSKFGGLTISSTIDKYVYGIVTSASSEGLQVISADYQSILGPGGNGHHQDDELKLIQAMVEAFPQLPPLNVFLASEVPPGTGLGSSGAVAVNLASLFATLVERPLTRTEAAELAYHVEVERLGAPVGKQDQYASAYGGINATIFEDGGVTVEPLRVPPATLHILEERLMLFYTGTSRAAWNILREQQELTSKRKPIVIDSLHGIKELAFSVRQALEEADLVGFSRLLDEGWQLKKRLASGVTNERIDAAYEAACREGALGGKLTGAGGGGFMLLYCEEATQPRVRQALGDLGMREMCFRFDHEGARVMLNLGIAERRIVQYA